MFGILFLTHSAFTTYAPSCDTTKHVARQQRAKSVRWIWARGFPVNYSAHKHTHTHTQAPLPLPTVPSSGCGLSEGQQRSRGLWAGGIFWAPAGPLRPLTLMGRQQPSDGAWGNATLRSKPFPCSPTLQPDRLSTLLHPDSVQGTTADHSAGQPHT